MFSSLLFSILISTGFFVEQSDNIPIEGAWVGDSLGWFGFTDANGFFEFSEYIPDSIIVHATGYTDWNGITPSNSSRIILQTAVFNTGNYILVTSSRGSLSKILPSTTMLDVSEISTGGLTALNGRVAGVSVREYGGSMPVTSVSIRGADASQVDYQVAGNSIVSMRDGMPTALFDPSVFSTVEIARGGASNANGYGGAGVINYLPPLTTQPLFISSSILQNGGFHFNSRFSGSGISVRRNVGAEGSVGYSSTLLSTFVFPGFRAGFLGGYASGEVEAPNWSLVSNGLRKQGQIETWITKSNQVLEADLSFGFGYMDYYQTEPLLIDDTHKDASIRGSVSFSGPVYIKIGSTFSQVNSSATEEHSDCAGTIQVANTTGFLTSNLGCKISSSFKTHYSGRVTASNSLLNNDFTAFCSVFSDFKDPTINDLFWPGDGFSSGNPSLLSERSTGGELGFSYDNSIYSFNLTGFATISDELIMWLPDASGIWSPSNISSSISKGIELGSSVSISRATFSASGTWNVATDETEGSVREGMLLPYRPEYSWGISSDINLWNNLRTGFSIAGMGKRFTNRTQTEALDEYYTADVSMGYLFASGVDLEFGIGNLTNTIYEETNGYDGMGRTFRLTTTFTGE